MPKYVLMFIILGLLLKLNWSYSNALREFTATLTTPLWPLRTSQTPNWETLHQPTWTISCPPKHAPICASVQPIPSSWLHDFTWKTPKSLFSFLKWQFPSQRIWQTLEKPNNSGQTGKLWIVEWPTYSIRAHFLGRINARCSRRKQVPKTRGCPSELWPC